MIPERVEVADGEGRQPVGGDVTRLVSMATVVV